jgi:hypothetical protein
MMPFFDQHNAFSPKSLLGTFGIFAATKQMASLSRLFIRPSCSLPFLKHFPSSKGASWLSFFAHVAQT